MIRIRLLRVRENDATTDLDDCHPIPVEYALPHKLLDLLRQGAVHARGLTGDPLHKHIRLFLVPALLKEHLRRLCKYDSHQELDNLATQIRRRRVEKVVVYVSEHAS